ncbi:MAG: flippase activity-associated protein Agl23 [Candidatus Promineifilaceae bacterium]
MSELTTIPDEIMPEPRPQTLAVFYALDWEKVLYTTFVILAILSRFWSLGDRVVSHDESLHVQYSFQFYDGQGYDHTPLMHGPFLFHITALSYWLFGANDFTARIPTALFGVVLILLPYFFRNWLGRTGALVVSFIFLISPYTVYYARYIRNEAFVVVWALLIVWAIWMYLRRREEKYLWWFAAANALLFSTKEVSFIYTAIFGSFLLIRLFVFLWRDGVFHEQISRLARPLALIGLGVALLAGGFAVQKLTAQAETPAAEGEDQAETFAADPTEDAAAAADASTTSSQIETLMRWVQFAGLALAAYAVFLTAKAIRPQLDHYGEFDLVLLYTVLILPMLGAVPAALTGWTPRDYSLNLTCEIVGQDQLSPFNLALYRLTNPECLGNFFASGTFYITIFLVVCLVAAILLGLWWHQRRFWIALIIFQAIFTILHTSLFTNLPGWASGMVDSLAYWMAQQEVERGSQPLLYYFFVVPLYEYLSVIFSAVAIGYWVGQNRLRPLARYWGAFVLTALLAYTLVNWFSSRIVIFANWQPFLPVVGLTVLVILSDWWWRGRTVNPTLVTWRNWGATLLYVWFVIRWLSYQTITVPENQAGLLKWPGLVAAAIILLAAVLLWFLSISRSMKAELGLENGWRDLFNAEALLDFIPFTIWWLILSWIFYSVAGEKMPWLSAHFVPPMALLVGWYFNERLTPAVRDWFFTRPALSLTGLMTLLLIAIALAGRYILFGQVSLGDQSTANLSRLGQFLGSLIVVGGLVWLVLQVRPRVLPTIRPLTGTIALFILLSLLTLRTSYQASYPNGDYPTEYLVYAHGAPTTKGAVMTKIEELSYRLYGDRSMQVAFDNDSSWPMTWYLRNYPNRLYYGDQPGRNLLDAPVIIVGDNNYNKVQELIGDTLSTDYEEFHYNFIWWPNEDYREISWDAIFGTANKELDFSLPDAPARRGLTSPAVLHAFWDIFFYRDYTRYSELFNKDYRLSNWPLRHGLRLYIRNDVKAGLWDFGAGAANAHIDPYIDPYAENDLVLQPDLVLTGSTQAGSFFNAHNVAVAANGTIYVLDAGNSQVQYFDRDGVYQGSWGSQGAEPGQFNDPWGITVDEEYVYVADTWNHRVQIFSLDGAFISQFGRLGSLANGDVGDDIFYGPRNIVVLDNERLLIADTGNHRIQIFDKEGVFSQSFGGFGAAAGQMYEPVGLSVAPDGTIYLGDTWNGRIQRFDTNFTAFFDWGVNAWRGDTNTQKPFLAIDSQNRIYITDPDRHRVIVFDVNGNYVARFGQFGTGNGQFNLPNGLFIDAADNIYVADVGNNRIVRFAPLP